MTQGPPRSVTAGSPGCRKDKTWVPPRKAFHQGRPAARCIGSHGAEQPFQLVGTMAIELAPGSARQFRNLREQSRRHTIIAFLEDEHRQTKQSQLACLMTDGIDVMSGGDTRAHLLGALDAGVDGRYPAARRSRRGPASRRHGLGVLPAPRASSATPSRRRRPRHPRRPLSIRKRPRAPPIRRLTWGRCDAPRSSSC